MKNNGVSPIKKRFLAHLHPDSVCQCITCGGQIDLFLSFYHYGLGVGTEGRDSHSRTAHGEVTGEIQNLSGFPCNLHLFLRVAIFLELVNMGDDIEW